VVTVHHAARGFDSAAGAYARGRPDYPPEALARVAGWLDLRPGALVADLGAGTGTLGRRLAGLGARVLAVDPSGPMLRYARGPGVTCVRAVAEVLPVRDGALEGAASGTAFHWFDGPRAVAELHRTLRPGARLALLWNVRDEDVAWVAELGRIVNRGEAAVPRYRHGTWRRALEAEPRRFRLVGELTSRHVHVLTPAALLDRVESVSFVAAAGAAEREGVLREVRALLAGHPDTAGREQLELAYRVEGYAWERVG
jgi:SAM-dependent methyltransferase